jgi:TolB-like protein
MSDSLRELLQRTLGAAFTLERELGGGGMSRVFVAEEVGLSRRVVIKVLAPELGAGVDVERFRREILLAAGLQHPHIVPLLSAGAGEGMLYYTMPFIDGLSLRSRLASGGEFAIHDASKILREVADALAYAHRQGVVHRDIKPDNVLYSGGHAAVTDFGVARALATTSVHSNVTSIGMVLGTPAYMSPEQALADPTTDHRTDIYAFGVLAYELLTGDTPFGHRSPQQLLAAHATEAPARAITRRASIPPALDAVVMRCLEKRAADRPQTADELLHDLEAIATPGGSGASFVATPSPWWGGGLPTGAAVGTTSMSATNRRRRTMFLAIAAVVVVIVIAVALQRRSNERPANAKRIVVAPFENQTGDASLAPVGSMVADWLTTGLVQTGLLDVVDARTATIGRAGTTPVAIAGNGGVAELARATGAGTVVTGAYYRRGDSLEFQARIVDAATNKLIRALDPVRSSVSDPLRGVELFRQRLTGALAALFDPRLGVYAAELSQQIPSFEAYKEFMLGVEFYQRLRFPEAAVRFERAVQLDTGFDAARMWQAGAYGNIVNRPAADSVYALLDTRRDRLSTLDRAVLDYHLAGSKHDFVMALRYAREAATLWPDRWAPAAAGMATAVNRPHEADSLLVAQDPTVGFLRGWEAYWLTRLTALHMLGRHKDELEQARRARIQYPDSPYILESEFEALAAMGQTDEIRSRLGELLALKGSQYLDGAPDALNSVAAVLRAHGHIAESVEVARRSETWIREHADSARALRGFLIDALYLQNRFAEVRTLCEEDLARTPNAKFSHYCVGATAARLHDRATAEREISALERLAAPGEYGPRTTKELRAQIWALLGEKERAMSLLRDAYATGAVFPKPEHEMDYESLRDYPAFKEFLRPKG